MACGLLYNVEDIFADRQFQARENILRFHNTRVGDFCAPGTVPKLSATPGRFDALGPRLGEHNGEIYGGLLQKTERELADLKTAGVI
jgi:crotonobetainyl-CoA:carnitine CoA-transferase CaiB-like acyl-CoA transferase